MLLSHIHNTHIISGLHPYYQYLISVAASTVDMGPSANTFVTTLQDGKESVFKCIYYFISL